MNKKMRAKITSCSTKAVVHPRVRSLLNIMTGPSVVLAELHPSIRIPRSVVSDEDLVLYPCARTHHDPGTGRDDRINVIDWDDLDAFENQETIYSATKRALVPQEQQHKKKRLGDSPSMTSETDQQGSELSLFLQLDQSPEDMQLNQADTERGDSFRFPLARLLPAGEFDDAHRRDLISLTLPAHLIQTVESLPGIASIEAGATVRRLQVTENQNENPPHLRARQFRKNDSTHLYGEGVVVGIIDVEGFDFSHQDFLDEQGETRFLSIWDQAGDALNGNRDSPGKVKAGEGRLNYGSEITRSHMNNAIANASRLNLRATTLEPQTSMKPGSHGTHVAFVAAGNRGVCRKAVIIVRVSLALGEGEHHRRCSEFRLSIS